MSHRTRGIACISLASLLTLTGIFIAALSDGISPFRAALTILLTISSLGAILSLIFYGLHLLYDKD